MGRGKGELREGGPGLGPKQGWLFFSMLLLHGLSDWAAVEVTRIFTKQLPSFQGFSNMTVFRWRSRPQTLDFVPNIVRNTRERYKERSRHRPAQHEGGRPRTGRDHGPRGCTYTLSAAAVPSVRSGSGRASGFASVVADICNHLFDRAKTRRAVVRAEA